MLHRGQDSPTSCKNLLYGPEYLEQAFEVFYAIISLHKENTVLLKIYGPTPQIR